MNKEMDDVYGRDCRNFNLWRIIIFEWIVAAL
jgi:hypothetical protein